MAQLTLSEENLVQIIVKYVNEEYGINIDYACVELISEMRVGVKAKINLDDI